MHPQGKAVTLRWRKSSRSEVSQCVEAAGDGRSALLRDSHDPEGQRLILTPEEWNGLLQRLKEVG